MNIQSSFNEEEWKAKLREAHHNAVRENHRIIEEIENIIKDVDPVELLSHICLLSQFAPEGNSDINHDLRELPILPFLTGLCLKPGSIAHRPPDGRKIQKIIELLKNYLIHYTQSLVFQRVKKDEVPEAGSVILSARLQKIFCQLSSDIYPFQLYDLLEGVFADLHNYFTDKFGFSTLDALNFGQAIIKRYERLLNIRIDRAKGRRKRAKRELKREELVNSYFDSLMFTKTQDIFVFTKEEVCREEGIGEVEKFAKYLEMVSCNFGDADKDFNSPLGACRDTGFYFSEKMFLCSL